MVNRNFRRALTIRLSESQFKKLSSTLIEEQLNKSQFIREAIDQKLESTCRNNFYGEKFISKHELLKLMLKN